MKKTNLLFTLCALTATLVSCDQTNSGLPSTPNSTSGITPEEKANLDAALTKAKVSVNFNGSITSIYVEDAENSVEGDMDITITDSFMEWKKTYQEFSGDQIDYNYTFIKDADGKMSYKKLNVMNQVQTYNFYNPRTDEKMDYDKYCLNPFATITSDDFTVIEERYYLSEEKVGLFNGLISLSSTERFSYYDFEVSSVSLSLGNKKFSDIIITTKPRSDNYLEPADFFLDCTFNIACPGELTLSEIQTKDHRDEHDILASALKNFQESIVDKKNYTVSALGQCDEVDDYTYDNYATEDGFYSDFKEAFYNYKVGYKFNSEDGKFHKYKHFVSGADASIGDGIFDYEGDNPEYVLDRKDLDLNFVGFAPEFFLKKEITEDIKVPDETEEGKTTTIKVKRNQFYTTNSDVVDEIHRLVSPFYDRYEPYYIATRVFFNLSLDGEIVSWGWEGGDAYASYKDTITYTIKDVGTTVLPINQKADTSK